MSIMKIKIFEFIFCYEPKTNCLGIIPYFQQFVNNEMKNIFRKIAQILLNLFVKNNNKNF